MKTNIPIKTDVSGKWVSVDDLNNILESVVGDCVKILEYRNNHAVIVNSIKEIKEYFGVE